MYVRIEMEMEINAHPTKTSQGISATPTETQASNFRKSHLGLSTDYLC
jgi:hypothetical protein